METRRKTPKGKKRKGAQRETEKRNREDGSAESQNTKGLFRNWYLKPSFLLLCYRGIQEKSQVGIGNS